MATPIEGGRASSGGRARIDRPLRPRGRVPRRSLIAALVLGLAGCSGEPSERQLKNRRELEAVLTAVSLKNKKELDKDAERIEARHASGELSDAPYQTLRAIIKKAGDGDWAAAEKQAYQFREATPFFD